MKSQESDIRNNLVIHKHKIVFFKLTLFSQMYFQRVLKNYIFYNACELKLQQLNC